MDINKILEVNELLKQDKSLNQLEKDKVLECSRKAFKNRALKLGYIYNDTIKQFVKDDSVTFSVTNETSDITEVTQSVTKKSEIKQKNQKEIEFNKDKAKELEERIKILEDIVLQGNTHITHDNFIIDDKFKEDIITRSIKVSRAAIENFNSLAENKFSMYKKQDLLTTALIEFYEKYK